MSKKNMDQLSRRERQIMDVIYQKSKASASEVHENLPDAPSYSAVRALLKILLDKGYLKHEKEGKQYIYFPAVEAEQAKTSMMKNLLKTFFNNSASQAVAALIDMNKSDLSDKELDRLSSIIDKAKEEGK